MDPGRLERHAPGSGGGCHPWHHHPPRVGEKSQVRGGAPPGTRTPNPLIKVAGGSPSAWATPPPADSARCRRLIINGGFRVDGGRYRQLGRQASALGYPDLHTCLQALCDAGYSTPRLAKELDTTPWLVSWALRELGVRLPPRPERLAQQRRRAAEERIAARVMELGFADVRAYLVDRIVGRGRLVVEVVAELGAAPGTVQPARTQPRLAACSPPPP
jgi:hypothetical protein